MIDRDLLLELVSAGILASSPDNSEPWKFKLLDDGLELRLDQTYLGMFFDANEYASLLGCGGVIEIIRLTAAKRGYRVDVTRYDTVKPDFKVAKLQLVPDELSPEPLSDVISSRCTFRGYFNKDNISLQIISNIERSLDKTPEAHIHWFSGQKKRDIIRILTNTDRLRYTHKELHHDFCSKLRFGKEIERRRDGLAANTLGLEPILTFFLPILNSWLVARTLNFFGMHYFMAWRGATVPLKNAAEICALVMPDNMDPVEQGTVLHRLWLAINANKELHCQIFGAFPLFIYRMKECNGDGFDEKQKSFLQKYITELEELIGLDSDSERVIVFFRLGYPRQNVVRSLRRPVESFLID